jgi:hypothetical protein
MKPGDVFNPCEQFNPNRCIFIRLDILGRRDLRMADKLLWGFLDSGRFDAAQIAASLGRTVRTVRRRTRILRDMGLLDGGAK